MPRVFSVIMAHRAACAPGCPRAGLSALVLSAATLLLLLSLALTLTTPLPLTRSTEPAAVPPPDVVPRFYAALDALLASTPSGDDAVFSPSLVVVQTGLPDQPFRLWLRQLMAAHPLAAMLRLTPTAQIADGDRVAVTVQLRRTATAPDDALPPVPLPAATLDELTVAQGRVVAYAPGPALAALPWTRPPAPLPTPSTPAIASVVRLRLAPGGSLADLVAPGPVLLLVEQGHLAVTWASGGWLLRATETWQALPAAAHAETLAAGDALLLPAAVAHTLRNPHATPTDLLLLVDVPVARRTPLPLPASNRHALAAFGDLANPQWTGRTRPIAPGVSATVLASAADGAAANACPRALTISQLTMGPGVAIAAHRVDGVELVVLESGWLMAGFDAGATPPALGTAGNGVGRAAGIAPLLRNDGVGPLPLVVFSVTPQRAAPCRSPEPPATAPVVRSSVHPWHPAS